MQMTNYMYNFLKTLRKILKFFHSNSHTQPKLLYIRKNSCSFIVSQDSQSFVPFFHTQQTKLC